jgi:hypothetical protein
MFPLINTFRDAGNVRPAPSSGQPQRRPKRSGPVLVCAPCAFGPRIPQPAVTVGHPGPQQLGDEGNPRTRDRRASLVALGQKPQAPPSAVPRQYAPRLPLLKAEDEDRVHWAGEHLPARLHAGGARRHHSRSRQTTVAPEYSTLGCAARSENNVSLTGSSESMRPDSSLTPFPERKQRLINRFLRINAARL